MTAAKDSWKREPFTAGASIPYVSDFTQSEFARIREGLVPEDMDDKWFIYFDDHLYLHRSWTGAPVYRVSFTGHGNGVSVTQALCAEEMVNDSGPEYAAQLLDFLIRNLLLGEANEFPTPPNTKNTIRGLVQHVMSGTAYAESSTKSGSRRHWWAFWRR